ncbi:MAG: DUF2851 family protein [Chthoniobacterales bacterium]
MTPAEAYAPWSLSSRVDERLTLLPKLSELEIQARWFAGKFPVEFHTTDGRKVEIIHRGVWNREPGPDFCEAVVRFGNAEPKRGSIELDTNLKDWENHGHATNPAFNNVVLHLFLEPGTGEFFTRTEQNKFVPQVRLQLTDDERLPVVPPLAIQGRCAAPLTSIPLEVRTNLIEAAAHFRLQKKAEAFARLTSCYGWDEALFQTLAITLGYKENKNPFELLAQRIGLQTLRAEPASIDSLLFGCAGFLDATSLRKFAPDTQEYLRALWERWWSMRIRWERLILPRSAWKLTGSRPANHPQRRLAALGLIAKNWPAVSEAFRDSTLTRLEKVLGGLQHPYWSEHYTISSRRSAAPIALLGRSRILEMLVNVAVPASLSTSPNNWRSLAKIQQPLENRKLKTGILRLFGSDVSHVKTNILQQQGILQIYEDFCLRDLTDCARCPFPKKVLEWEVV